MIEIFSKTFKSFRHRSIWKYVALSVIIAGVAFYGLYELISGLTDDTKFFDTGWIETITDFIIKAGAVILSLVFFPTAMLAIVSLFEEKIAKIIERKEYVKIEGESSLSLMQEAGMIIRNLLWNILFFPLYLIPVIGIIIYYAVNAHLIGNTVFRIVSARNFGAKQAKVVAKDYKYKIRVCGLAIVFLTSVPVINVIAPIFAIILMVHLVQSISLKDSL